MNIFLLEPTLSANAHAHCNSHIVKMPLEAAQIASTARHLMGLPRADWQYKPTHANHPCTKWAAESLDNLGFVLAYGMTLAEEYGQRYHRRHATMLPLESMAEAQNHHFDMPPEFPIAIKEHLRRPTYAPRLPLDLAIAEYRAYYLADKAGFAKWPAWRGNPSWWPE